MSGPLQPPSRQSTGIAGLDEILHGGLPARRLHLVQGEPGTGKTTLALQFLLEGVRQGDSCLYVTLAESAEELAEVARSHGWSLEGLHVHAFSELEGRESAEAQNTLFHPAEVELHDTVEALFSAVHQRQPARAVIDSLSELRMLSQSAWGYRRQVLGLKAAFDRLGCTTLLVDDLTATGAQAHDRQVESVVHGVIVLRRSEPAYGPARFRLSVRKPRGSDFAGGAHDYAIRRGGLVVFPRVLAGRSDRAFTREPISCGVAGIDQLLGGGLDRGTSTLVLGPAGAGKSTLALTFAGAVA
ncbi:MAG: AAA family ATPase [Verrucomicrobia bacterium]|nr:AAA family ATPase [Verrucomicrobiota bacterium]